jgi:hypothetical protein
LDSIDCHVVAKVSAAEIDEIDLGLEPVEPGCDAAVYLLSYRDLWLNAPFEVPILIIDCYKT